MFSKKINYQYVELQKGSILGKTQAAEINKNKEKLRSKWESAVNVHQKRSFLKEGGSEIDKMCFNWFAKARSQNIPISGPILKGKAMEIAGKLGVPNLNASDGWLNKWRIRNNVAFKCVSGEAADVNQDGVEQLRTKLPSLLTGYKPQDIYNADESALTKPSLLNPKNAWAVHYQRKDSQFCSVLT
ncbi:tigger transposable element-derived protein 6-like [Anastrepha ludens]|uniref:tigger transposable element-derived protein 6-like n=1 Tax=Anastrepha ludens TaxID=28586 RepID=UPI0023B14044|nr:tigger transposable element-derived protein 6-like [Anastrepha ludens]